MICEACGHKFTAHSAYGCHSADIALDGHTFLRCPCRLSRGFLLTGLPHEQPMPYQRANLT